ncbi:hypothetical protein GGX14DRAFT_406256 [Mycena pura]|uniref:Uncharacterized protein n=1 Tax=Mycena pura TaxID=153505 RepID=A0AAD6XYE2_9AGAR|nr:hypothetical protein GGX14DRAFT_406256 [Mycena pura]
MPASGCIVQSVLLCGARRGTLRWRTPGPVSDCDDWHAKQKQTKHARRVTPCSAHGVVPGLRGFARESRATGLVESCQCLSTCQQNNGSMAIAGHARGVAMMLGMVVVREKTISKLRSDMPQPASA